MPIRATLLPLYPKNWQEISQFVRFSREKGRCQNCGRGHGQVIHQLQDGRWFDTDRGVWRDKFGNQSFWPNMFEFGGGRRVKIVLAAGHIEHDPRIIGDKSYDKIASWCQKCHLNFDRPYHIKIRKLTKRSQSAVGDLFLGAYSDRELLFVHLSGVMR